MIIACFVCFACVIGGKRHHDWKGKDIMVIICFICFECVFGGKSMGICLCVFQGRRMVFVCVCCIGGKDGDVDDMVNDDICGDWI